MYLQQLNFIFNELMRGNLQIAYISSNLELIQNEAVRILNTEPRKMTITDLDCLDKIIKISNIIYNNTDTMPPLEDGIYDKLMVRYRMSNPDYQVGAPSVNFGADPTSNGDMDGFDGYTYPVLFEPEEIREGLFYNNIMASMPLDLSRMDIPVDRTKYVKQERANILTPHKYPKLVGTLDKCKFVLNKEAIDLGLYNDPDVTIFERDFLGKHVMQGIINPNGPITLILELKYDGMSVEADVTNRIISARSRGDTNQDLAEDLNPVLKDYVFPYAPEIPIEQSFGMKFECIITKPNLEKYGKLRGRPYKNSRNGVVGLMKSADAYAYRDLITLVPLETSLDIDPITEIEFMNKYYCTDTLMKYAVVEGNYDTVLYQVYDFVKEAEKLRDYIPFMYDGVVVHYVDPMIRSILGRKNSVNQYSIAIKFNPMNKNAIFTRYEFTVGQNGVITPLIHHTPVEFIGTIHTKSSGHSLQRFNELNLAVGDVINIQYRNDVMPYVTRRVSDEYNRVTGQANGVPVQFPTNCPSCGQPLAFYDSGKTAVCINFNCPGRTIARTVNMMKKLNIKGFADSSLDKLNVVSLTDLLSIRQNPNRAIGALGLANGQKLLDILNNFLSEPVDDYRIVGSLGFSNIAIETWKKILNNVSINDILYSKDIDLFERLCSLKGIGEVIAKTIVDERHLFQEDLKTIQLLGNVITSFHAPKKKTIRYTGCRPPEELTDELYRRGWDANPNASVTKSTDILIVPEVGHDSSKVRKSGPNTKIIAIDEFIRNLDYYLRL